MPLGVLRITSTMPTLTPHPSPLTPQPHILNLKTPNLKQKLTPNSKSLNTQSNGGICTNWIWICINSSTTKQLHSNNMA